MTYVPADPLRPADTDRDPDRPLRDGAGCGLAAVVGFVFWLAVVSFVIGVMVGRASSGPQATPAAVPPNVASEPPGGPAFSPLLTASVLAATGTPRPARRATPRPTPGAVGRTLTVSLTWYCRPGVSRCTRGYPGGHYAAASPDLLALGWRGRVVRACWSGSCTTVRIIDCSCQATRSLDLYAEAFDDLADLGRGRLRDATAGLVK